ncbi:MAG TPA: HAMP domain-containing sensor histidine kinase [Opitutaceae bacterium]|nr:HAMP domain-containing sensor histidine kinase [Opitutaceae bacterium]
MVTLTVFAGVVAYVTWDLRAGLREQILRREADALMQVASVQLSTETETLADLGLKDAPGELLNAVLRASTKIQGVFAVRVFDSKREFNGALPLPWSEEPPPLAMWQRLESGRPITHLWSRLEARRDLPGLAMPANGSPLSLPVVSTWVPLRTAAGAPLAGVAQFWIDGQALALEFQALDRKLLPQAATAFLAGATLISLLLGWAYRRLAETNRQLSARTDDLLRANRELALAAKASALGTVTAHLMHELKNPVVGLEEFVVTQSELGTKGENDGEFAAAFELTKRLRTMINDVVSVMRDEETGTDFELTCEEIAELAMEKIKPAAAARAVTLERQITSTTSLSARRATLGGLVLRNLLQNAVEASSAGTTVRVEAEAHESGISFRVRDHGGGLPAAVRERLFQPCASTKRGGSGLGLALSQQLARQAGGRIELEHSDEHGTCFRLVLPREGER